MPSTYTTRNRLEKQAAGENSNTWGTRLNTNVIDMLDEASDGMVSFTLSGTKTLTTADGATDEARKRYLNITGGTGGTVTVPNAEKAYLVRNGSSGDVVFTTGSGTTATVKSGNAQWVVCEGGNVCRIAQVTNYGAANLVTTGTLGAGATTLSGGLSVTGTVTASSSAGGQLIAKDSAAAGAASTPWVAFADNANARQGYIGFGSGANSDLYLNADSGGVRMRTSTTASAANLYQDADLGVILRSTSSLRYKTGVEDVQPAYADAALNLRPVYYRSLAEADPAAHSYWGYIAEEVAKVDPRLVHYDYLESDYEQVIVKPAVAAKPAVLDADGNVVEPAVEAQPAVTERRLKAGAVKVPDGVQYERIPVLQIAALKAKIASLEARMAAAGI